MTLTRAASLLAATALAVTGLTACGDDTAPAPTTTTASPIDKGTDEPSETTRSSEPAAAQEHTKAGAVAFTRTWFEKSGESIPVNDTEWLAENSTSDCPPCTAFIKQLEAAEEAGLHGDQNPTAVSVFSARERPDGGYRVQFKMVNSEYSLVDNQGKAAKTFAPMEVTVVTETKWQGDRWIMADWLIK